jgi:hypothetical protein
VSKRLNSAIPSLQSQYPLSDLDGMTIWYETRLLEEGIEDLQSLITANVVDLMLNTRIPVGRIVDWLDQAFLYIHLAPVEAPLSKREQKRRHKVQEKMLERNVDVDQLDLPPAKLPPSDREVLRRYGIRCATDLEDAFSGYMPAEAGPACRIAVEDRPAYYSGLKNLIGTGDPGPSRTLTILNCLQREPNLEYVRNWKAFPAGRGSASPDPEVGARPGGRAVAAAARRAT